MVGREAARAMLIALAVGDALGLPIELKREGPRASWADSLEEFEPIVLGGRAVYSDDTEQTLILAESIVESCGFNPVDFVKRLAEKARTWDPVRNYGIGVSEVVEAVRKGIDWRLAARRAWGGQGSYGNACAVRVPPIVVFYETRSSIESMAVAQAMVTHVHPLGVEGARLYALALYEVMEGAEPDELPRMLAPETMLDEYREKLEVIPRLLDATPEKVALVIGNKAAAPESIPAAIYVFAKSGGDVALSIAYALSLGGDADSIAAMAATLAAAYNPKSIGNSEITRVFDLLESREAILEYAERLVEASARCHQAPL